MNTSRESVAGSTRKLAFRILLPCLVALGMFATADTASGDFEGFLPDCSPGQTTNCIVGTELNGVPTTAIKANVSVQSDSQFGKSYLLWFTQPDPLPSLLCPSGLPPITVIVDGRPALVCPEGPAPSPNPACPGLLLGGLGDDGETVSRCGDLTQVAPAGTRVGLTVNLGPDEPKMAIIRGGKLGGLATPNRTWTSEETANGTVVQLETEVTASSLLSIPSDLNPCSVFPVVKDCGGPSAVATWTGTRAAAGLYLLDSSSTSEAGEVAGGTTIATDAQTNGPPGLDPAKQTMSFRVAAPHFRSDGTLNRGYVESYLPNSLLESRFGVSPNLTPGEMGAALGMDKTTGSSKETLAPIVTRGQGGVFYSVADFGYSSPLIEYVPRKAAEPPAPDPPATEPPAGAFNPRVKVTRKKVSVTLDVAGKSTVSVAGRIGKKAICKGTKAASKASSVTVSCKLSRPGKKVLAKAKRGSRVDVKVTLKATGRKTQVKNISGLIP